MDELSDEDVRAVALATVYCFLVYVGGQITKTVLIKVCHDVFMLIK